MSRRGLIRLSTALWRRRRLGRQTATPAGDGVQSWNFSREPRGRAGHSRQSSALAKEQPSRFDASTSPGLHPWGPALQGSRDDHNVSPVTRPSDRFTRALAGVPTDTGALSARPCACPCAMTPRARRSRFCLQSARGQNPCMAGWATLGVPPPNDKADRVETGRFVRAMLVRTLAIVIPVWIIVFLMEPPSSIKIVAVVSVVATSWDIAWLSHRIRRDERRRTPN